MTLRPRGLFAGLATLDVVNHVERAPETDEKVTATWQLMAGGGPALNAAVVFAALGGQATLLTRMGSGAAADLVTADLETCGVHLLDAAGDGVTPPVSSITVEADGSRRVVGFDSTNQSDASAPPSLPDGTDVVLVDGHHPDLADRALALGETHDAPRLLDAGRWKPAMAGIVDRCTHVVASAAFRLDGAEKPGGDRLRRLTSRLAVSAAGVSVAAITAGGGAIRWRERAFDGTESTGLTHPPAVDVVDTLGAGDALHGAYAWALATGHADPLAFAAEIAALSCTVRGTRSWLAQLTPGRRAPRAT